MWEGEGGIKSKTSKENEKSAKSTRKVKNENLSITIKNKSKKNIAIIIDMLFAVFIWVSVIPTNGKIKWVDQRSGSRR